MFKRLRSLIKSLINDKVYRGNVSRDLFDIKNREKKRILKEAHKQIKKENDPYSKPKIRFTDKGIVVKNGRGKLNRKGNVDNLNRKGNVDNLNRKGNVDNLNRKGNATNLIKKSKKVKWYIDEILLYDNISDDALRVWDYINENNISRADQKDIWARFNQLNLENLIAGQE